MNPRKIDRYWRSIGWNKLKSSLIGGEICMNNEREQFQSKRQKNYVIIGGSSGIGFALAERLSLRGDKVIIGGRSQEKLDRAISRLNANASARRVDINDRESLRQFFAQCPEIDGLFTPAASYRTGSFAEGLLETSEYIFQAKFWGQYWAVHTALKQLSKEASIVLMSGAASVRPIGAPAYAACNAALEGLARGLAIELNPIRVNCLSPGTTDSELWRLRPSDQREAAYAAWESLCLAKRPATVNEQADAALFLLDNKNMNGSTIYCDGGYSLR